MIDPAEKTRVTLWREDRLERIEAEVPVEHELSITLDGNDLVTLLCLPTQMKELVLGFLHVEGFIRGAEDIDTLELVPGADRTRALVQRKTLPRLSPDPDEGSWIMATGCGGSLTLARPENRGKREAIVTEKRLSPTFFYQAMVELSSRAQMYRRTGGCHSAALLDTGGEVLFFAEDIGRHNAADKANGARLLSGSAQGDLVLATTGRITSEICWKALQMRCPWVASPSVTSSRAKEIAAESGITLVGSVRGRSLRVYTHAWRVQV